MALGDLLPDTGQPADPSSTSGDWFSSIDTSGGVPGANTGITGGMNTGYSGGQDLKSLLDYWKQSHPASNPDIPGLVQFLNQQGLQTTQATHAGGLLSDDKIVVNGQMLDLGTSFGGPGGAWFDSPMSAGSDTGGGGFGPLLDAYPGTPPSYTNYPAFQMPTGADALKQDPGYQFRVGQGEQALQQSAAARGVLNTGGTLKDILNYGQQAASQEYGNVFDRALKAYQTNYGTSTGNYQNLYQQYLDQANMYRNRQADPTSILTTALTAPPTA